MFKQVIIVRADLKMPKGKLATQCCHASVECILNSDNETVNKWMAEGGKKVILKVTSEKELIKYFKMAKGMKLKTSIIKDSGKTFFKEPTTTCIGIGPDLEKKIDNVSGNLKML
ncbi:MAG: peptidyl-tRNA hydrolase Pth2 [Nanoarchaeota archaeon]